MTKQGISWALYCVMMDVAHEVAEVCETSQKWARNAPTGQVGGFAFLCALGGDKRV